ncbi:uncharacterized protein AMSG_00274 [Thecamonas trahens ATCC 50062]|uniref:B box-type domain-containing protein n=1 Tax=Thecamonas trahens ATCC 50062 TaxID=461836 RepID=A0A0L0D1S1_THETB|nr:hypothetical protein AMSG_00274 [Thecamonas trahens ATCC 50062]KNC46156.1 hypothetical protein AMSG_00274 [Thecamonas trahens ATCC 50062]|eukprot:XP_013763132.1 hypothetical protein AMSG_00274 [Thecamonas trahens ATCC 50062]
MAQHTPVPRLSLEFAKVEYQLKLALQATTVELDEVAAIGNPNLSLAFEARAAEMMTLYAWVDAALVGDLNSVDEVMARGFRFQDAGMLFAVGSIVIPDGAPRDHQYMLCKIAVGRSYVVEEEALQAARVEIPEGYDSIYVHSAASEEAHVYHHEYLLQDPAQVLPLFLVNFKFDPASEAAAGVTLCEVCEEAEATLYCQQDDARLCKECDAEIHSANKLVQRHTRSELGAVPLAFGDCAYHPGNSVEYFCPIDHVPVCVHCKMIGSHASGEAASHKLITIREAYAAALDAANRDDPTVGSKRSDILKKLSGIDSSLRAVQANAAAAEERIYELLQAALFQLQVSTQAKLALLLGDELEMRRQLGELEHMDAFLTYQRSVLKPTNFLEAWNKHLLLRAEIHDTAPESLRPLSDVQADLQVVGEVVVTTASAQGPGQGMPPVDHARAAHDLDMRAMLASKASSNFRALVFRDSPARVPDPADRNPAAAIESSMIAAGDLGRSDYGPRHDDSVLRAHNDSMLSSVPHSAAKPVVKSTTDLWSESLNRHFAAHPR